MATVVDQFKDINVLVIGDVMIDAYYFGRVDRISPEAPVPVVAVQSMDNRLGGAANVAMNIVSLGAKPIVCSVIGNDQESETLIRLFKENKIGVDGLVKSSSRKTTQKLRVIAQSTQMLRIDNEDTHPINDDESKALVTKIKELLNNAQVVIFEDYDKGVLTQQNIQEITEAARKLNIPVVVDPKKLNFSSYIGVDLFKPNLKELKEGLGITVNFNDLPSFELAIQQMMKEMQLGNVMVTMSERGVMITDGKQFEYIPAHIRKIADVSGAGDTVISVAALCLALGLGNFQTASFSNLAGGLVCEEVGVVPIQKKRLQEEILKLK